MRAGSADGEYLAAGLGQEDGLIADMPNQHGAVSQLTGINTLGKVGA
jgi:hypothetical protein